MNTVTALEQQLDGAKTLVEFRRMALKLAQNREFKKLILEEFCVNEAARYVQNSANPALGPDERADCLAIAQAAGHLKRWLSVQVQMGAKAESEIPELEDAIAEARLEEDDGIEAGAEGDEQ
jgi:hypothetical protein